jgi:hypothetical protein
MLLGLVEIGHGINSYLTVLSAARDAARLGAQGAADDTAMRNLVLTETDRLPSTIPSSCVSGSAGICITHPTISSVPAVGVEVCYDHPMIIGIPLFLDGTIRICSKTTMRVAGES